MTYILIVVRITVNTHINAGYYTSSGMIRYTVTVFRAGSSSAVVIPAAVVRGWKIQLGDKLTVEVNGEKMVVKKGGKKREQ